MTTTTIPDYLKPSFHQLDAPEPPILKTPD